MLITFYALFMAFFMLAATAFAVRNESNKCVHCHTRWNTDH
jgi:hypothetical protein